MTTQARELLYYRPIKESRGDYFVEYYPPVSRNPFATLNVVYPDAYDRTRVESDLQKELAYWLTRYDVPIMASAFDAAEDAIYPNGNSDDGFLYGWRTAETKAVASTWKQREIPAFFNDTSNIPDWRTIYTDIPVRTDAEVKADAEKEFSTIRTGARVWLFILIIWVVIIPAAWAIIQLLGPDWLAWAVTAYSLFQVFRAGRKLIGYGKRSRAEEEKAAKELKMGHYFYHCERNPDGFARLKAENFARDLQQRTRAEAAELAKNSSKISSD